MVGQPQLPAPQFVLVSTQPAGVQVYLQLTPQGAPVVVVVPVVVVQAIGGGCCCPRMQSVCVHSGLVEPQYFGVLQMHPALQVVEVWLHVLAVLSQVHLQPPVQGAGVVVVVQEGGGPVVFATESCSNSTCSPS